MGFNGIYDGLPSGKHTKNYGKILHANYQRDYIMFMHVYL
jgi:hypothetical protein